MVQTLRRSYNLHSWYEHVRVQPDEKRDGVSEEYVLRDGSMDLEIIMADKELTFEADRAKVLFLERQSKLLG